MGEAVLQQVVYTDPDGRKFATLIPVEARDAAAAYGVPIGPPRLTSLGLPRATEVRLNNELFARGILTPGDAVQNRPEVAAALMAALRVDAGRVIDLYLGEGEDDAWTERREELADA